MTVEKGQPWGAPGRLPDDGVVVDDDASASAAVDDARRRSAEPPVLGLVGGDLARTCGASGDAARLRSAVAQRLPVDLGVALVDGAVAHFVAHLIVRRPLRRGGWLLGPITAVMNAQFLGGWDVAPRGHPNDGHLDVLEADPSLGDRLKARTRLASGTHLPHPDISLRRLTGLQIDVPAGSEVWIDGRRLGRARTVSVRVEPDALHVVV